MYAAFQSAYQREIMKRLAVAVMLKQHFNACHSLKGSMSDVFQSKTVRRNLGF